MAPSPWAQTKETLDSIWSHYTELFEGARTQMLGLILATVGAMVVWNVFVRWTRLDRAKAPHRAERVAEVMLVLSAIAVGVWLVVDRASLFDDAFISFRYSRNFADGHGLVFNVDERVEGYTNFLWTFFIGLVLKATSATAPAVGLWSSLACFVANLVVVWRIGRVLARPYSPGLVFPTAVWLLAVQYTFTIFGTSGLETGCASLMVNLGALFLITSPADGSGRRPWWAGFFLILATLTRPDHALYYVVGSAVVFGAHVRGVWQARREGLRALWDGGLRPMVLYAAPFLLYLVYLAWKVSFYGQVLPNTYYAKSADLSYYEQGVIYAAIFYAASQLWIAYPLMAVWLALPSRDGATRRFKAFAVPSVILYNVYVMKVGGDFMHGRFYVTVMPLLFLSCGQLILALGSRLSRQGDAPPARGSKWPALVVAPMLVSTAGELPFFAHMESHFYVVQERDFYKVTSWSPVEVNHSNFRIGRTLGNLKNEGAELTVATSGIGMLGYYSEVPIIDLVGLTDAHVARQPLEKRGRPGHEKWADGEYIAERSPHLVRGPYVPHRRRQFTKIRLGKGSGGRKWHIWRYDRTLMRRIQEVDPNVKFKDFEHYLDGYIKAIDKKRRHNVIKDLQWFRSYYFDHNDDAERLDAIVSWIKETKGNHR